MKMKKSVGNLKGLLALTPKTGAGYQATVVKVVDGDTIDVKVESWANTPFETISLRIAGIDTPECSKAHAKCAKELALGVKAQSYARTLAKPGDAVAFQYLGHDKYFRIDAAMTLSNGTDWAMLMLNGHYAVPYAGGKKKDWCK